MTAKRSMTALLCALALAVGSLGAYVDNATAAGLPVTSDDAPLFQETMERGATKNIGAKTNAQKLEPGLASPTRMGKAGRPGGRQATGSRPTS